MDARQKSRIEGASRVLTGNRLRDGRVVWFTASGDWSERIGDARILPPGPDPEAVASARADVARRLVVDVYEVDLGSDGTGRDPTPVTERERIRAFGPSVHPEFAPPGR